MGLPLPFRVERETSLHVAVPSPARALRVSGVVGHKAQLMGDDVRDWHGLPISSPERAFCELGAYLQLDELVAVGDHLICWRLPMSSADAISSAIDRYPGRRGRALVNRALPLLDALAESPQESRLRVMLAVAGISGFATNHPVSIRGKNYRIDIAFPGEKVAIEYQGDYHRDPAQWRRDMSRRAALTADGWLVIEVNADDLENPAELVALVRSALTGR